MLHCDKQNHKVRILTEAVNQLWKDLETDFIDNPIFKNKLKLYRTMNEEKLRAHLYHILLLKGVSPLDLCLEYNIPKRLASQLDKKNRRIDLVFRINDVLVELKIARRNDLTSSWTGREKKFMIDLKKQLEALAFMAKNYVACAVLVILIRGLRDIPAWLHGFCESHDIMVLYHCVYSKAKR